jgi:hypothetical protein
VQSNLNRSRDAFAYFRHSFNRRINHADVMQDMLDGVFWPGLRFNMFVQGVVDCVDLGLCRTAGMTAMPLFSAINFRL